MGLGSHLRDRLPLDYEFSENCGLNDFGDHVMHPFKKCPPGQCNPDFAELCGFCGSRTRASTPERSRQRCGEVLVWLRLHGQRCSLPEVGWDVEGMVWDWDWGGDIVSWG